MDSFSELEARLLRFSSREFGTGASADALAAAERALGVTIEGSYRRFLMRFGWGGVEHLEVNGLGAPPHLDLVRLTRSERAEMEPGLPDHLLPLMNDGAGNLLCLDTRIMGEPPVVFWDHEAGPEQTPDKVAQSFSLWLTGLLDEL